MRNVLEIYMVLRSRFWPVLSMALLTGLGALAMTGMLSGAAANEEAKDYTKEFLGRWTVDDVTRKFTERGNIYDTLDVVPCGKDVCGVSISKNGKCDGQLFRITPDASPDYPGLQGKGKWGNGEDVLSIFQTSAADGKANGRAMTISIGQRGNPMSRVASMPLFRARYTAAGEAKCSAG